MTEQDNQAALEAVAREIQRTLQPDDSLVDVIKIVLRQRGWTPPPQPLNVEVVLGSVAPQMEHRRAAVQKVADDMAYKDLDSALEGWLPPPPPQPEPLPLAVEIRKAAESLANLEGKLRPSPGQVEQAADAVLRPWHKAITDADGYTGLPIWLSEMLAAMFNGDPPPGGGA